jgi:hypothetical protein
MVGVCSQNEAHRVQKILFGYSAQLANGLKNGRSTAGLRFNSLLQKGFRSSIVHPDALAQLSDYWLLQAGNRQRIKQSSYQF